MTKPSKVLYLITKSNYGGAQKYVLDLATNLPKEQYEVLVAFGGTGDKGAETGLLAEKLAEAKITTRVIKSFTRDIFWFNEPKAFWEVGQVIKQFKPDVLHLNSSKAAGIGAFMGRLWGVEKIIYTAHGWPFNESRNPLIKLALYFFSWLTSVFAHHVIVLNQTDLAQGKRMWLVGKKMHLIYNGLAPIPFLTKTEARAKLGQILNTTFTDDELILGSIAELHPNKNWFMFLPIITSNNPNWKLIIIGDGPMYTEMSSIIKQLGLENKIFLTRFVQNAATLLKAFDCFALLSIKEGLPYVIIEAGQANIPVIGSNIPGIVEILKDSCGLITKVNDGKSVNEAIQKIESDQALTKNMANNLSKKVTADFSLEKMIEKTTFLY